MGLRLGALDDDARYDAWIRIVRRIYDEQVAQAWGCYMFRLLRAVFVTNQHLSEEGGFHGGSILTRPGRLALTARPSRPSLDPSDPAE